METTENALGCPAIAQLIEFSKILDNGKLAREGYHLKWVPYSELIDIELIEHSTGQSTHYAKYRRAEKHRTDIYQYKLIEMILVGTRDECTQEFIQEFARTHSLPTHKYDKPPNINQFRRYATWLTNRNEVIEEFTNNNDIYYLVTERRFRHNY